jgi:hypothetical protein
MIATIRGFGDVRIAGERSGGAGQNRDVAKQPRPEANSRDGEGALRLEALKTAFRFIRRLAIMCHERQRSTSFDAAVLKANE